MMCRECEAQSENCKYSGIERLHSTEILLVVLGPLNNPVIVF